MAESRLKSESRLQSECYQWFYNTYPNFRGLLFHVPNQLTSNNAISAAILKGMGVYPGVSDFVGICPVSARFFAIEMKTPTGKQSPAQKKWENRISEFGVKYYLCSSLEDFKSIISEIYGSPERK